MFAVSSTGLIAIGPVINAQTTSGSFFVFNPKTDVYTTYSIPGSVHIASETAQIKHVVPSVSSEDQDANDEEKDKTSKGDPKQVCQTYAVRALTFTPDSKYVICATDSCGLYLYNVEDAKLVAYIPLPRKPTALKVSPDGRFAVVADRLGDVYAIKLSKLLAGEPVEANLLYSHGCVITTLDFVSVQDKTYFVSADQERKIRVSQFPDFFIIESMCMGHKSTVGTVTPLPAGEDVLLFTTSSISPIITHEKDGVVVTDKIDSLSTQLSLYNVISGTRLQNVRQPAVEGMLFDDETNSSLAYYTSTAVVDSLALLVPASCACTRKNGRYVYGTTNTKLGAVQKISAVQINNKSTAAESSFTVLSTVVVANDYDVKIHGEVASITAVGQQYFALTNKNVLLTLEAKVDGTVSTITVVKISSVPSAEEVTNPYVTTLDEVQCRELEAYFKHEDIFKSNQEKKKSDKKRKGNDSGAIDEDEEYDEEY